jgi:hypothetical protein
MVVAAGSRESAPLEPIHCAPKASQPGSSIAHLCERNSSMKNRKRESCTSGTVRDEDGNILIYSALLQTGHQLKPRRALVSQSVVVVR